MKMFSTLIVFTTLSVTACAPAPKITSTRLAGSWESLQTVTAYKATGVDPYNEGAMLGKEMRDGPYCIGSEFAAKESLFDRAMGGRIGTPSDWKIIRSSFENGKVDVALQLNIPNQDKILTEVTGTLTPTTNSLVIVSDVARSAVRSVNEAGQVHIVQKIEDRRIGDCTPGQLQVGVEG
jgi:hypothetical protein